MTSAYSRTTLNGDAWWWGVPLVYVPKGPSQIYYVPQPKEVGMGDTKELIAEIRRAVEEDAYNLTEWEDEFLQSIAGRATLSDKQDAVLERIWRKATGRSE